MRASKTEGFMISRSFLEGFAAANYIRKARVCARRA
jgi:hypothetical protein